MNGSTTCSTLSRRHRLLKTNAINIERRNSEMSRSRLSQSLPNHEESYFPQDYMVDFRGGPPTPVFLNSNSNGSCSNHNNSFQTTELLNNNTNKSPGRKKWRPMSYAEPGGRNRLSFSLCSNSNSNGNAPNLSLVRNTNSSDNGTSYSQPDYDSSGMSVNSSSTNSSSTKYNGHNITDLEARLLRLRQQQWERRKSISDFAISCIDPTPISYAVMQQQV